MFFIQSSCQHETVRCRMKIMSLPPQPNRLCKRYTKILLQCKPVLWALLSCSWLSSFFTFILMRKSQSFSTTSARLGRISRRRPKQSLDEELNEPQTRQRDESWPNYKSLEVIFCTKNACKITRVCKSKLNSKKVQNILCFLWGFSTFSEHSAKKSYNLAAKSSNCDEIGHLFLQHPIFGEGRKIMRNLFILDLQPFKMEAWKIQSQKRLHQILDCPSPSSQKLLWWCQPQLPISPKDWLLWILPRPHCQMASNLKFEGTHLLCIAKCEQPPSATEIIKMWNFQSAGKRITIIYTYFLTTEDVN